MVSNNNELDLQDTCNCETRCLDLVKIYEACFCDCSDTELNEIRSSKPTDYIETLKQVVTLETILNI